MERRGRPPTFTRDELIAAARRLGPDAVSLPALAAELGVARTSIYWHIRDRDEIGELVLGAIIEEGDTAQWAPASGRSWDEVMASTGPVDQRDDRRWCQRKARDLDAERRQRIGD